MGPDRPSDRVLLAAARRDPEALAVPVPLCEPGVVGVSLRVTFAAR